MKNYLLIISFIIIFISKATSYDEIVDDLAPVSLINKSLVFEFYELFEIAFKTDKEIESFADFIKANNNVDIIFLDDKDQKLNNKSYIFAKDNENTIYISRFISFVDLLKLQQEYYNDKSDDIWLYEDKGWSMVDMMLNAAKVLVNKNVLKKWGWNNDVVMVAKELAKELYRITNPSIKNSIEENKNWNDFLKKVSNSLIDDKAIERVENFIFKDAENDIKWLNAIVKKEGRLKLFNLVNQRYKQSLIPQVTLALDDLFIRKSLRDMDYIEISNKLEELYQKTPQDVVSALDLDKQSKRFIDRVLFSKEKKTFKEIKNILNDLKTKGHSDELLVTQLEILQSLNYQISKYASHEASNATIGEMINEKLAACVGCSILGGKILSELGFNVYTIQVIETYQASKTPHVALLVELCNGSYQVFDAAMPNAFATINLFDDVTKDANVSEKIKRLKLGDCIDYTHIDFNRGNTRAEVQLIVKQLIQKRIEKIPLTKEDIEKLPITHPRFQILPYMSIYSCILNNLGVKYFQETEFEKAIYFLNKAIQLNKNYDSAYCNLGEVYLTQAKQILNRINDYFSKDSFEQKEEKRIEAWDFIVRASDFFNLALKIDASYKRALKGLEDIAKLEYEQYNLLDYVILDEEIENSV